MTAWILWIGGYLIGYLLWARWCMNESYRDWKSDGSHGDWEDSKERAEGVGMGFGGGIIWPLPALFCLAVLWIPLAFEAVLSRVECLFIPERRRDEKRCAEADVLMEKADESAKIACDLRESDPVIAAAVQDAATSYRDQAVELRKAAGR